MASSAASSASYANPWASMPQETQDLGAGPQETQDLGGGVLLEDDVASMGSMGNAPQWAWQGWAPRGIALLENLGDKVPSHFPVPPHPHAEWPNCMTPEVPDHFETLDKYIEFRTDYVWTWQKRSSGYRERVALYEEHQDLEHTADGEEDELKGTELPVFMTLRPMGDLRCHRHLLVEDLQLSKNTIQSLISLTEKGPDGILEANRILYHLIKDKAETQWHQADGASRWVHQCVQEASEALLNWRSWNGRNFNPSIHPGRPHRSSVAGDASRSGRTSGPPFSREVR